MTSLTCQLQKFTILEFEIKAIVDKMLNFKLIFHGYLFQFIFYIFSLYFIF